MRRLIWSPDALGDLVDIQSYLAEFNPATASPNLRIGVGRSDADVASW